LAQWRKAAAFARLTGRKWQCSPSPVIASGVATEAPDLGTPSPETLGATTVRISLDVDDPDAVASQAIEAGGREMFAVADQPYGMRQGRVVDPFGHHWLIGRRL
jgi:PhnB protein